MTQPRPGEDARWPSVVVGLSVGVGALFFLCYTGYVLTGWGPFVAVPPVVLVVALQVPGFARRRAVVDGASTRQLVTMYLVFLPAGVVVVEAALLLGLAFVFTAFGGLSAVAEFHRQWLGATGFAGPIPLIGYTLLSTAVASLVGLVFRTIGARARAFLAGA